MARGENALACINDLEPAGTEDNRSWERIENAFEAADYRGFTFLRLVDHAFRKTANGSKSSV